MRFQLRYTPTSVSIIPAQRLVKEGLSLLQLQTVMQPIDFPRLYESQYESFAADLPLWHRLAGLLSMPGSLRFQGVPG